MAESLPLNPKPLTGHKPCWLAVVKRSAMIKRKSLIVGQPHGGCLGLLCGQRPTRSRARATDEQQHYNNKRCYFHKNSRSRLTTGVRGAGPTTPDMQTERASGGHCTPRVRRYAPSPSAVPHRYPLLARQFLG